MAEFDPTSHLRRLFEQAVVNGLRNPDPIVRRRNALRVPTHVRVGPAVRAELVRLVTEDANDEVRTACADALAILDTDTSAIEASLVDARRSVEPVRLDRLRQWLRARFMVLVPAPAAGSTAWPFFERSPDAPPRSEAEAYAQAQPTARLVAGTDGTRVTFKRLPSAFEGFRLRVLVLSAADAGWHESDGPVIDGAATVVLKHAITDARELGDIWLERQSPAPTAR
jgi:hypothetical protein